MGSKTHSCQFPQNATMDSSQPNYHYQFRAGIDFTYCEKGWCRKCSIQQQRHCERESAAILNKFPPSSKEEEKCRTGL